MSFTDKVLDILRGGIWHTTHPDRFRQILLDGYITPNPKIPEEERWGGNTPETYPYVRKLGGISLFDFRDFDPNEYQQEFPLSSWSYFVPAHQDWGKAIWIKIKKEILNDHKFIDGKELLKKREEQNAFIHRIMPKIECAYIGNIYIDMFEKCLLIDNIKRIIKNYENCLIH